MKRTSWVVAIVAVFIFVADQLAKLAVTRTVGIGGQWTVFPDRPDLLNIIGGMNTGGACGYFPQLSFVFTLAPFFILAIVIYFYRQQVNPGWLLTIGTGLIIGGAFGNLVDRLRLGYVVDFVQILRWPVFNVADASVSTAVVLLLFWSLKEDSTISAGEGVASSTRGGLSWKLMLSFIVLLGVLSLLSVFVCVWLPAVLPR